MRKGRKDLESEGINTITGGLAGKKKRKHDDAKLKETQTEDGQERMLEGTFEEKDVKQKQRKSKKKRGGLRQSGQEELDLFTESVQSRQANGEKEEKAKKKKKLKRDRWGQKIHDSNDKLDVTSFVEEEMNVRQAVIQDEGLPRHEDQDDLKKVCVGGMPYDTTEEDILEQFAKCGTVTELSCMRFTDTKRFKGLAFISFETEAAAREALALDGAEMGGRFIRIEQAKKKETVVRERPKKIEGCLSAYIGNLAWDVQQIDIKRFFKGCQIKNVRLAVDKTTDEFRGYGHVDFADDVSLERGIKLDQTRLFGRPMKVAYVVPNGFQRNKGAE